MKIISGKYKGKKLKGYEAFNIRPTMDRVKESVFAMIQEYIKNSIVLDLYAGTGNLGIEAMSNGSKEAYFVDNNKNSIDIIKSNIKSLNVDNTIIINDSAKNALNTFIKEKKVFDIIFLDPPYNTNLLDESLIIINDNINLLSSTSLIICETEKQIDYTKYNNFYVYKTRQYGNKNVNILKINK